MSDPGVWLIAGPTASGKSALALRLAEILSGEIVNADSMQVYADLRVLSARPDPTELARAPHHLYGVADGAEAWSVGHWLRAAEPVLAEIAGRGRPAIVVGGTGLYFRALIQGLSEIPAVSDAARAEVEALYRTEGEAAVRTALAERDPVAAARIEIGDRQRLVRALAVARSTGRALSAWQAEATTPVVSRWTGVVIDPPRPTLYARCDARLETMVQDGALAEVEALMARGLDPALPVMKALGVPEFAAHLRGELTLAQALDAARQSTRRYAKRQTTWFRNQTADWPRIETAEAEDGWRALLSFVDTP